MMDLLSNIMQFSRSNRVLNLENQRQGSYISGDFEGSVTATWVKVGNSGEGIVSYRNKQYVTVSIGFVSLPRGTRVKLSHSNGIYYSSF